MTIKIEVFMWLVGIFFTVLLTLVGFIVTYILKSQATLALSAETSLYNLKAELFVWKKDVIDSVTLIKKEQDEIKYNYLKRFEIVNNSIHSIKEEIVNKIHDLHNTIIEYKN